MPSLLLCTDAAVDAAADDADTGAEVENDAAAEARTATMALLLSCGLACDVVDASLDAPRASFAAHATRVFRAVAAAAARGGERDSAARTCDAAQCLAAAVRVPPLLRAFLADVSATTVSPDADAAANVLRQLITAPWLHAGAAAGDNVDDAHDAMCAAAAAYKALALALCRLPGGGAGGRDALRAGWGAAARLRHDAPARVAAGIAAVMRADDARCALGAAAARLRGARARAMAAHTTAAGDAEQAAAAEETARAAERGAASVEALLRLI
jgi:hypothetical protein